MVITMELCYPDESVITLFGGKVEHYTSDKITTELVNSEEQVVAVLYDVLQVGYKVVDKCNKLRLWRADAIDVFDYSAFNSGDYFGSVEKRVASETISKVLYPNDETTQGKELRLKQQFFFVRCFLVQSWQKVSRKEILLHWKISMSTIKFN